MRKSLFFIVVALYTSLIIACKEVQDIEAFTKATYSLSGITGVTVNGIDLQERLQAGKHFSNQERDSLLAAVSANALRLNATMALQVHLPDTSEERSLTVTKVEWLMLLNGQETLKGVMPEQLVLYEGLNTIELQTVVQLAEKDGLPNYEGLSRIINLINKQADMRSHVTLQIKPTIRTPLGNIPSPNFITVSRPGTT